MINSAVHALKRKCGIDDAIALWYMSLCIIIVFYEENSVPKIERKKVIKIKIFLFVVKEKNDSMEVLFGC